MEHAVVRVLFVCMGNICRSPTAEGTFKTLVHKAGLADHIFVDSAGTHGFHVGSPPDPRAQQAARARGIELAELQARQVVEDDFSKFDLVLAMDEDNYRDLQGYCGSAEGRSRIRLLMDFAPRRKVKSVPDPYYGGRKGFENVLDMIEEAAAGLLAELRSQNRL